VLFYACDPTDLAKQQMAQTLIASASNLQDGVVSVSVLGEFFTAIVLGKNKRLTAQEAEGFITNYAANLEVVPVEWELVPKAIAIHRRFQTSYFDSLHLAAAAHHGCGEIWSEDLTDGQDYGGVVARNPFKGAPP